MTFVSENDLRSHSFIVRLWREGRERPDAVQEWRGVVEHVPSGERRYFLELSEIVAFIQANISPVRPDSENRE